MNKNITKEWLREVFHYNPLTGIFTWRARDKDQSKAYKQWNTRFAGKPAGRVRDDGYMQVSLKVDGKATKQFLHRLAVIYMGDDCFGDVDHMNGSKDDNRYSNLRCVTHQKNRINLGMHKGNTSGVTGVTLTKSGSWQAQITSENKNIYLGSFVDFFEAVCARKSSEVKHGFFAAQKHRRA